MLASHTTRLITENLNWIIALLYPLFNWFELRINTLIEYHANNNNYPYRTMFRSLFRSFIPETSSSYVPAKFAWLAKKAKKKSSNEKKFLKIQVYFARKNIAKRSSMSRREWKKKQNEQNDHTIFTSNRFASRARLV